MLLRQLANDESSVKLFAGDSQDNHASAGAPERPQLAGRTIKVRKVPAYERRVEVEVIRQFWQEYLE